MTKHHERVSKHLGELRKEGIENLAADDRSKLTRIIIIAGGVILVLLMLSFVIVTYPIGDIIAGQLQSTPIKGDRLVLGDLTIHFEGDTAQQLRKQYFDNPKTEFSVCLVGSRQGADYFITSLYKPTTFSQSFNSVRHEPCSAETVVMLHTHPYKSCRASETDIATLEKSAQRNPDVLMAVMCEPNRVSVYKPEPLPEQELVTEEPAIEDMDEQEMIEDAINLTEQEPIAVNVTKEETAQDEKTTVELLSVNEQGTKCWIRIGDTKHWFDEGKTERVNGVLVHVFDAIPIHGYDNDACEAFVAGESVVLQRR